jgi:hypothetical protein
MSEDYRSVELVPATDIRDDVPVWVWEHGGKGRIQLGTLALFAGRPGAGKSSAARWFAAGYSTGSLAGCWLGEPKNVAYIAPAEESVTYIVKPGLRAAGADMGRIFFPEVRCGDKQVRLMSVADEEELTQQFIAKGITVVIVDPLMDTIGANVDIHRNNEVRAVVDPWARMADRIDGVAHGVVHLNKAVGGDVVAGVNGSSAFGEVARAVFGFAKDPESDGDRIMSQAKNSTGEEDLSLTYRIESETVRTDSGRSAEVGKFNITGDSDRTVGDVLSDAAPTGASEAQVWLEDYLTEHAPARSRNAKEAGKLEGFSGSTIDRAARKLRVVAESEGFPRVTFWSLSQSLQALTGDVTDVTDATDDELHKHADVAGRDSTVTSATSVTSYPREVDATARCPVCGTPYGTTGKCVPCIVKRRTEAMREYRETQSA